MKDFTKVADPVDPLTMEQMSPPQPVIAAQTDRFLDGYSLVVKALTAVVPGI